MNLGELRALVPDACRTFAVAKRAVVYRRAKGRRDLTKWTVSFGSGHFHLLVASEFIEGHINRAPVSEAMKSKLFELFSPVHPAAEGARSGLGLGLGVAKRLAGFLAKPVAAETLLESILKLAGERTSVAQGE